MAGGLPGLPSDALAAYHFAIEIDSVTIAQFREVSGITSEVDVIELKENTADGKLVIHKLPGNRKPPTITLKRATNTSKDLWDWHEQVFQGKVSDARKNGSIVLYSYDHGEVARYNFTSGWPSKVSIGNLGAGTNEMLMEEITIVCEELSRVS